MMVTGGGSALELVLGQRRSPFKSAAGEESFGKNGCFTMVLSGFQSFLSGSGMVESCPNLACQVHYHMVNRPYV